MNYQGKSSDIARSLSFTKFNRIIMKKKLKLNKRTIANLSDAHKIVGGEDNYPDTVKFGNCTVLSGGEVTLCCSEQYTACCDITLDYDKCNATKLVECLTKSVLDPNCNVTQDPANC